MSVWNKLHGSIGYSKHHHTYVHTDSGFSSISNIRHMVHQVGGKNALTRLNHTNNTQRTRNRLYSNHLRKYLPWKLKKFLVIFISNWKSILKVSVKLKHICLELLLLLLYGHYTGKPTLAGIPIKNWRFCWSKKSFTACMSLMMAASS